MKDYRRSHRPSKQVVTLVPGVLTTVPPAGCLIYKFAEPVPDDLVDAWLTLMIEHGAFPTFVGRDDRLIGYAATPAVHTAMREALERKLGALLS